MEDQDDDATSDMADPSGSPGNDVDFKPETFPSPKDECLSENYTVPKKGTWDYEIYSADCGLGYDPTKTNAKDKPWKIVLYGSSWDNVNWLSGCKIGPGHCPFAPMCKIVQANDAGELKKQAPYDVALVFQNQAYLVNDLPAKKENKPYKVLWWREAFLRYVVEETQRKFDFQMGVHVHSGIWNPPFFRTPMAMLGGLMYPHWAIPFYQPEERKHFALSVISHCFATSKREVYINRLVHYLGPERVHQYGACGNMKLPPRPIRNAAKLIATYKFYLSFENTIQDGYVTEKLLHVISMPVVPVYYGTAFTPNFTTTPSYIKVSDFSHPKHLADYLVFLDNNSDEYMKFHAWRFTNKLFRKDFVQQMQMKTPGPKELLPVRNTGPMYPRTAACCRLCDESHIQWIMKQKRHFIEPSWGSARIDKQFFQNRPYGDPVD